MPFNTEVKTTTGADPHRKIIFAVQETPRIKSDKDAYDAAVTSSTHSPRRCKFIDWLKNTRIWKFLKKHLTRGSHRKIQPDSQNSPKTYRTLSTQTLSTGALSHQSLSTQTDETFFQASGPLQQKDVALLEKHGINVYSQIFNPKILDGPNALNPDLHHLVVESSKIPSPPKEEAPEIQQLKEKWAHLQEQVNAIKDPYARWFLNAHFGLASLLNQKDEATLWGEIPSSLTASYQQKFNPGINLMDSSEKPDAWANFLATHTKFQEKTKASHTSVNDANAELDYKETLLQGYSDIIKRIHSLRSQLDAFYSHFIKKKGSLKDNTQGEEIRRIQQLLYKRIHTNLALPYLKQCEDSEEKFKQGCQKWHSYLDALAEDIQITRNYFQEALHPSKRKNHTLSQEFKKMLLEHETEEKNYYKTENGQLKTNTVNHTV